LRRARDAFDKTVRVLDSEAGTLQDRIGQGYTEQIQRLNLHDLPVEVLHEVLSLRNQLTVHQLHVAEESTSKAGWRMTQAEARALANRIRSIRNRLDAFRM
jgi:hypothetical protein